MAWMTKPASVMPAVAFKSSETDLIISSYGYGLGLMLASYDGWQYIHHGGYFPPYHTLMSLFPSQNLGVFTSTNEGPLKVDAAILHAFIFEVLRGTSNPAEAVQSLWDKQTARREENEKTKEKALRKFLEENTDKESAQMQNEIVGKYGSGGSGNYIETKYFYTFKHQSRL